MRKRNPDDELPPVPENLPGVDGFCITSNGGGRHGIYKDSKLVAVVDDIEALAQLFDHARCWLQLARHPIVRQSVYTRFLPPPDHPSNFPN